MFGINERALIVLRQKFLDEVARHQRGIDQIEGFGRAYVSLAAESPVYFDVLSRCELVSVDDAEPDSNVAACLTAGDGVFDLMRDALERGIADGTVRPDVGSPRLVVLTLWGFMHGILQVATNKPIVLAHQTVTAENLMEQGLELALRALTPPKH
jgi:hypothetical protein